MCPRSAALTYGIVTRMFFRKHSLPPFHADYGYYGSLPPEHPP